MSLKDRMSELAEADKANKEEARAQANKTVGRAGRKTKSKLGSAIATMNQGTPKSLGAQVPLGVKQAFERHLTDARGQLPHLTSREGLIALVSLLEQPDIRAQWLEAAQQID